MNVRRFKPGERNKRGKKETGTWPESKKRNSKENPDYPIFRARRVDHVKFVSVVTKVPQELPHPLFLHQKKFTSFITIHHQKKRSEKKHIRLSRRIFSRMWAYLRFRFVWVWIPCRNVTIVPIERKFCRICDRVYLKIVFSRTSLFYVVLEVKLIESFIPMTSE